MKRIANRIKTADRKWKIGLIGALGLLILFAPSYYFYSKYQRLQTMLKNPQAARAGLTQEIVAKVGARIQLPTGETPQLVTVSNTEKLSGLAFFKNAQNGDKVLLYEKAKMAYLYRPSTDALINAAPIVDPGAALQQAVESDASGSAAATTPSAPSPVTVAVYNGTATSGLAKTTGDKIKAAYPQATLGVITNAAQDHSVTVVIDLSGSNRTAAAAIAKAVGGQVSSLPEGEEAPAGADILVIAGGAN